MPYDALKQYFEHCPTRLIGRGTLLLHARHTTNEILLLLSGFVRASSITPAGQTRLVALHGPDDLVPIETLFSDEPDFFFYTAVTDVSVQACSKTSLRTAAQSDLTLCTALLSRALTAARAYAVRIQNLELKNARQRIIFRLLYLTERFGLRSQDDRWMLPLPITYQDLADAVNITRETANREVRILMKEGLVKKQRGRLVVLRRQYLKTLLESST